MPEYSGELLKKRFPGYRGLFGDHQVIETEVGLIKKFERHDAAAALIESAAFGFEALSRKEVLNALLSIQKKALQDKTAAKGWNAIAVKALERHPSSANETPEQALGRAEKIIESYEEIKGKALEKLGKRV